MNDNWQDELHRKWRIHERGPTTPTPLFLDRRMIVPLTRTLPPLPLLPLKVDFRCRVVFTCVRAYVRKIYVCKAMYERSLVSVKVEPLSTSRLSSTLFILPLFYLRD